MRSMIILKILMKTQLIWSMQIVALVNRSLRNKQKKLRRRKSSLTKNMTPITYRIPRIITRQQILAMTTTSITIMQVTQNKIIRITHNSHTSTTRITTISKINSNTTSSSTTSNTSSCINNNKMATSNSSRKQKISWQN